MFLQRYNEVSGFTSARLFKADGSATYIEPQQGGAGTCYFISAIATAAEFPNLIQNMFLTGTGNPDAGIIGMRFFIRGKPWVISLDDKLVFQDYSGTKALKFT